MNFSASIVIYNSSRVELDSIIRCFDSSNIRRIIIVDNSLDDTRKELCSGDNVLYIKSPGNIGFGAAHNLAFKEAKLLGVKYHFVVNPDILFESQDLNVMVEYMEKNSGIGLLMPQILNFDGSIQYLPKLLPSPWQVIQRRLGRWFCNGNQFIEKYELRFVDRTISYEAPIISGCFALFNLNALKEVGLYDERYFLYFEDWDLSRRMHEKYSTIYFPEVSVYHGYKSEASKNVKIFYLYIVSFIKYYNKWGWFFDKKRKKYNSITLGQFTK